MQEGGVNEEKEKKKTGCEQDVVTRFRTGSCGFPVG